MVLRKLSNIIPLGNLTKRGTAESFETKSRIGSELGSLRDRDSWLTTSEGFEECEEVSWYQPEAFHRLSNVPGVSFLCF